MAFSNLFLEIEGANQDLYTNNNGPAVAVLFFILLGLLVAGTLCVLLAPFVRVKPREEKKHGRKKGNSKKSKNKKNQSGNKKKAKSGSKGAVKAQWSPYRRFSTVWMIIIGAVAVTLCAAVAVLYGALREYESVQPGKEARRIYERLFEHPSADLLWKYADAEISPFETEDDAKAYLAELLESNGPDTRYYEVIGTNADENVYAVAVGDYSLGTFTVVRDENAKTKRWGFDGRRLGDVSIKLEPVCGISVFAPAGADVYVNGVKAGDGYAVGEAVVLEDAAYFPEDAPELRNMLNLTFPGLYLQPSVKVCASDAVTVSLVPDEVSGTYKAVKGPSGGEFEYALEFDENGNCSAENSYVSSIADSYLAAVSAEEDRRYREKLKAEEEERARLEAEEKARLEEEERRRLEEKAAFELSESLRAVYEARMIEIAKQYNHFFYVQNTDAHRHEIEPYLQPGTNLHYNLTTPTTALVGSYTNWTAFNPFTFDYGGISTEKYAWDDESHEYFTCTVHMTVTMYGYNSEIGEYITAVSHFDEQMKICVRDNPDGLLESFPADEFTE